VNIFPHFTALTSHRIKSQCSALISVSQKQQFIADSVVTGAGICNSVDGCVFWHITALPVAAANIGRCQGC